MTTTHAEPQTRTRDNRSAERRAKSAHDARRTLLGQKAPGLAGLQLAVFNRLAELTAELDSLLETASAAILDGDLVLARRCTDLFRVRIRRLEVWFECACRALKIKNYDTVLATLSDEAKRDAIIADTFAMLRAAYARSASASERGSSDASAVDDTTVGLGQSETAPATATSDSVPPSASASTSALAPAQERSASTSEPTEPLQKHFSQNELLSQEGGAGASPAPADARGGAPRPDRAPRPDAAPIQAQPAAAPSTASQGRASPASVRQSVPDPELARPRPRRGSGYPGDPIYSPPGPIYWNGL